MSQSNTYFGTPLDWRSIASQITSLTIVYSIFYSDADQRKHQNSASLAFVRRIHRWPSPNGQVLCGKCFHLMTSSCNRPRHQYQHTQWLVVRYKPMCAYRNLRVIRLIHLYTEIFRHTWVTSGYIVDHFYMEIHHCYNLFCLCPRITLLVIPHWLFGSTLCQDQLSCQRNQWMKYHLLLARSVFVRDFFPSCLWAIFFSPYMHSWRSSNRHQVKSVSE